MKIRTLKNEDEAQLLTLLTELTTNPIKLQIHEVVGDSNCHAIVLDDGNGNIIGFAALVIHLVPTKGRVARIEDVVITKSFRGQGLGERIIDELIEIARNQGIKHISLTSNPKREAARKLYQKKGFILLETGVFRLNL